MPRTVLAAVLAALALLLAGAPASAQRAAADPAALQEAKKLMQAMGAEAQFELVIKTMTKGMADLYARQHPDHAPAITEVMGKIAARFIEKKGEALDMVAPLYAERFTIPELKEIGAFYATPIGQKLIKVLPEITQASMQMGMKWGERVGREVEAEARRELKARGIPI